MALIKSISGIRGTIGGLPGENLTPPDLVAISSAYGSWIGKNSRAPRVVVGRDGRISGPAVSALVTHSLTMMGVEVVDIGLTTTPTLEMAVVMEKASGGIVISASHNPKEWNALKLLNEKGEFLSDEDGKTVLALAEVQLQYADVESLGTYSRRDDLIRRHVEAVCGLEHVLTDKIRQSGFKVVVDCINSTASISIPPLLEALGVTYSLINDDLSGNFAHDPEPLPQNLGRLMEEVKDSDAVLGLALDPDVDRLAFVCEDGSYFGEEYSLVAVADYLLSREKGPVVTNLSSTYALADVAKKHGCKWAAAPVGEAHVVSLMKELGAVLGGEGNGGVIYPGLHYGRDALVGIAFFLSGLAEKNITATAWKKQLPSYFMSKQKVRLQERIAPEEIIEELVQRYHKEKTDLQDGLKIYFEGEWVHMRKSNTEAVIRIYSESGSPERADELAEKFKFEIQKMMKGK